jgi:hypothetical protein
LTASCRPSLTACPPPRETAEFQETPEVREGVGAFEEDTVVTPEAPHEDPPPVTDTLPAERRDDVEEEAGSPDRR